MSSPLEQLQNDVEHCLLSLTQINTVAITAVRPRSAGAAAQIQTKINNTLAGLELRNGKNGTAIIIGMPVLANVNPNLYGVKGDLILELSVIENIMVNEGANGTGFTAESLAYQLAQMIPQMNFAPFGQLLADKQLITPRPEAVMEKRIEYRVRLSVLSHAAPFQSATLPESRKVVAILRSAAPGICGTQLMAASQVQAMERQFSTVLRLPLQQEATALQRMIHPRCAVTCLR